ncbi:MAG: hypothetical protein QOE97_2735 [Pseudonocardiales bacterium]|jgi:hypothetical protein|nr:hypothetical protein [Pseudonocardiales bacterium]
MGTLRVAILSVTVAAVLSSCSDGNRSVQSGTSISAGQPARQLVGSRWVLTEITTGHSALSVPESPQATWQFTADRQFLASDTVNAISGRYRLSPTGFATMNAGTTLVGYAGSDPVRLAVISAFRAMTSGPVDVALTSSPPNAVTMRVPGYVLKFRRSGSAVTFPPASPTSTASH